MTFKCIHLSDIHFRGLKRHEEYIDSFSDFFEKAKKLNPDAIFVGGDIVHSKTQGISPELIDILTWWFKNLASIADTHIILGNHDGLITNKHRQDAITPIIKAINDPRLHLYKKSGIYPIGIPGFNWGVFSCFDEENWEKVKPTNSEDINIAVFHGGVYGSLTDINWNIEGEVEIDFFKDFDFTFLGDIHKFQYLDDDRRIAYPGSTIQQNYGEDPGKGFLFWEIESKEKYKSTFHKIKHSFPFVTLDWKGDTISTVREALKFSKKSRFRIKSKNNISQTEIKHLCSELKEKLEATEVVFKFDSPENNNISQRKSKNLNLRDYQTTLSLLKDYYKTTEISEKEWKDIEDLLKKYYTEISKSDPPRNIKWNLKNMKFENVFAYGKDNLINFENLNGIIGIFGQNACGKSSIPGCIMYGLFNSTDRGPVSNLHIINSRKGHCLVSVEFSANGINYRVDRQSVKHQNRKGQVSASTQLNLSQIDLMGNSIKDMSGEQRRDTDKILRDLIGTREDFLLTSFASQGEMNTFIKNKATQRKSILANFLDLDIFEKIMNLAKEESYATKVLLDKSPEREWNTLITEKSLNLSNSKEERDKVESILSNKRQRIQTLKMEAVRDGSLDVITPQDIINQKNKIKTAENRLRDITDNKPSVLEKIEEFNKKLQKIENIKEQFPIDELKEKLSVRNDLEKNLLRIESLLDKEKAVLKNQDKSISLLKKVPCGDEFPSCTFIKESHKNKKLREDQKNIITEIKKELSSTKKALKFLVEEDLENKIEKYQKILDQESESKIQLSNYRVDLSNLEREEINLTDSLILMKDELSVMKTRVLDESKCTKINSLKKNINELEREINDLDSKRMILSESIGLHSSSLESLEREKKEHDRLLSQWRIYELIMSAVNKKGIPLQILTSELPNINIEIQKILHGVANFTVELEADKNSNSMDIYINYGDSKRIIECASGMEKMISSLAIRVALINISSLPKCDTLIIDEGFGSLDESNIEACNRLLESFKKWFRNILVISHIDAVKDSVDEVLEINKIGKDSRVKHE